MPGADDLAELSYEAAVRALELQERAVEQLRSRTGTLLAASSLTASFLGALAIQHSSGFGTLDTLGLLAMVASICLCVYVLLPKKNFVFSLNARGVYEQLYEFRGDPGELRRRLAYWLEEYWQANQTKIDLLGRYYFAAALALVTQLILWAAALGATIS